MKKILALLLSLLLVLSVITGCGAEKKSSNEGSTKISASVANEKQKNAQLQVPCGTMESEASLQHQVADSLPSPAQWVKRSWIVAAVE